YVREFSALDSEAKKRGFTIYFPHKSIPMLPRVLSENLCSLNERVDRLVFVFQIHLDQSGRVEKFKLFEGIIHSRRRFTYEEVDEILDNPNNSPKKDKEFLESLLPLKDLILLLRSKRLAHGYNFRTPDVDIQLDRELKFKEAVKAEETISHQLIEECMLLANICAASYFNYGIFRTHPTPDFNAISRLDSELADIGIFPDKTNDIHKKVLSIQEQADKLEIRETVDKMIIKSLKRAEYTYENVGHFGLGFERYTHFTSPIRRYSDLILHRLLKSIISKDKKQEKYINSQLPYTTKLITSLEGETTKIAWDYEDLVFVRWSKENEKKEFQGIVTDLGDKNKDTIVKLEEGAFGARVFCKFEKNLRLAPFDKVKVRIKKAVLIGIKTFGEISEVL
ncbi:MAG: RNB domain-containing ribonuclease, partial [Campylobacterales bacterium]|nr:RNB domain-containing ribonuclease [Campylobacterales bacterium]